MAYIIPKKSPCARTRQANVLIEDCDIDADVAAITLNGFTPPASGRVTVKVRGRTGGGAQTLIGNLPEGVTKANFALDKTGLPGNAALAVQDGSLILRPSGFMLIVK